MEKEILQKLVDEISELERARNLLEEVNRFIDPYSKTINNNDTGDLCYRITEYFWNG